MRDCLQDPDYWRRRAEQARSEAEDCSNDPERRQRLLQMAGEYERLGDLAEQRWAFR